MMRAHCDTLVEQALPASDEVDRASCATRPVAHEYLHEYQALLVSNELIRVAILWPEQWHESLEQARRR